MANDGAYIVAITKLDAAISTGKALGKTALYWGCWNRAGHFLHKSDGSTIYDPQRELQGFSWTLGLLDGGLLKNGQHRDVYDGKVFWTCGGTVFWYAFFWWDNSIDRRSNSNSGLYVRGFGWPETQIAFDYACGKFPHVIIRQVHKLMLKNPK